MNCDDFKIVNVNLDYLKKLNETDNEVMYKDNQEYQKKPFLGVLITNNGHQYVIPFTSAKEKHKHWKDVHNSYYRIYEIIDIRRAICNPDDVLVNIVNTSILHNHNIPENEFGYYKKRIISVLNLAKMIPVKDGVYSLVDLSINSTISVQERLWRSLVIKEYMFCRNIKSDIIRRATRLYDKQMETGKVLKYHCNYKKLEQVCDSY